ncbi:MAG: histidine--tRNA ligase [Puniceicoccaceae bacterium]
MFQTLPGFREFLPDAASTLDALFAHWKEIAQRHAFLPFGGPTLEPLDLYIEKSGPEIVGQLFAFEDRGGRQVALRPEMTPTVCRMVASQAQGLPKPVRWYSIAEQYRFERPQKGRLRSFYQFNLDILGIPDAGADLEIIACGIETLRHLGLSPADFQLRLSDRVIWMHFLELHQIAEGDRGHLLSAIDRIEKTPPEKTLESLAAIIPDRAELILSEINALRSIRSRSDLADFFLKRLGADSPLRPILLDRLAQWDTLLGGIQAMGLSQFVQIDLGIVRGLAYYTGFVFELFEASGHGRALGGGGRYDDLVEKLGGPPTPAVGLALGDVTLLDLLAAKNKLPQETHQLEAFITSTPDPVSRNAAFALAADLRRAGFRIGISLKTSGLGKQFKEGSQHRPGAFLTISSSSVETGLVRAKDSSTGDEIEIPLAEVSTYLQSRR